MRTTFALPYLDLQLPTAIVGMGITGRAVFRLLRGLGISEDQILTFDAKDPQAQYMDTDQLLAQSPKSLIVSPGVPLSLPWIQSFKLNQGQITSELALAACFFTTEKLIGISGAIGKSTVTALLQAGLQNFSPTSFVGGNLGFPLADYILKKYHGGPVAEWVALEISSYQLENFENLNCAAAILTYLTPNHLERYPDVETYYQTKWSLVERTKGPVILNRRGGDLSGFAQKQKGDFHWTSPDDPEFAKVDFSKAALVGDHNRDNLAMVFALSYDLHWPDIAREGFMQFSGLAHRLENLGLIEGIRWINDSKATAIESVLQAVKSTTSLTKQTTHLLLGGKDKNLPWQDLHSLASPFRRFYFFGEVREKAQRLSGLQGESFQTLGEAIHAVRSEAQSGDLVLLSPGGTSIDEFKSFEDRGDFFRNQILKY